MVVGEQLVLPESKGTPFRNLYQALNDLPLPIRSLTFIP